jgi:hypothetical protein
MRNHLAHQRGYRVAILLGVMFSVVAAAPLFTSACRPSTSITVTNNSNREIRHIYFSPTDQENWGPDQLNGSSIAPGGSRTVNEAACSSGSIKVIAEDQNGCFLYQVVSCGADSSWSISNDAVPDCGS